jgi:hypothetical protein
VQRPPTSNLLPLAFCFASTIVLAISTYLVPLKGRER